MRTVADRQIVDEEVFDCLYAPGALEYPTAQDAAKQQHDLAMEIQSRPILLTIVRRSPKAPYDPNRSHQYNSWSLAEDEIVRREYFSGGPKACISALVQAGYMERTYETVKSHAGAIGVHRNPSWVRTPHGKKKSTVYTEIL
ncbi:MAG: hypothetical protein WC455_14610 [Dehalococcoidia bacterium]|jgi:hypothetical protein